MKVSIPQLTNPINIRHGVIQEDTLSLKLFTLFLKDVFKNLDWKDKGIIISDVKLSNLRYADDIV